VTSKQQLASGRGQKVWKTPGLFKTHRGTDVEVWFLQAGGRKIQVSIEKYWGDLVRKQLKGVRRKHK